MKLYTILQFAIVNVKRGGMYTDEKFYQNLYVEMAENEEKAKKIVMDKIEEEYKEDLQNQIAEIIWRKGEPGFAVEEAVQQRLEEVILDVEEVDVEDFGYCLVAK